MFVPLLILVETLNCWCPHYHSSTNTTQERPSTIVSGWGGRQYFWKLGSGWERGVAQLSFLVNLEAEAILAFSRLFFSKDLLRKLFFVIVISTHLKTQSIGPEWVVLTLMKS